MWRLASTEPNEVADPWQLDGLPLPWRETQVPGTVGEENGDDWDWWYRWSFSATPEQKTLRFEGLATLAQVWLNGELILESDSMFRQYRVGVTLRAENDLVICFRSLTAALLQSRRRPRWKTRLVTDQRLRWFRTSLLGRIEEWAPPVPIIGPWRPIVLEEDVSEIDVRARLAETAGVVEFSCVAEGSGTFSAGVTTVDLQRDGARLFANVRIENPELWWPHTHGTPALYACSATIDGRTIDCGRVGFRTVEMTPDCELRVNGVSVFCRGACWTPGELTALDLLRDAGANMVRIGGTMVYEEDAFYDRCDELGMLVWQDFMFANMDYPADDESFIANVGIEAAEQVARLRRHPSVAVYCGNSEVEQQAAMLGLPRELWRNRLFAEVLPQLCEDYICEGQVYVPSSPSGGALPFHTGTGISHYYGVGAYRRPVSDARRANVRFASECLGFANVGEDGDLRAVRDPGSSWDFGDVRDHYLRELFSVDPVHLRSFDPRRYLELSRVVTGEVMAQVFSEWRSARGSCHGGLVWFLRDLSPGAGWGILDSDSIPKACFYYLRRVWQPCTVVLTDEGLDGVHAHVVNDSDQPLSGTLELTLLRDGHVVIANATSPVEVAPRSVTTFSADALFGTFYDTAYAYRFGPPNHDVFIATLNSMEDSIADAFHFPLPAEPKPVHGATISVEPGDGRLTIHSDRFLYAVHLDLPQYVPDDDYFYLPPGRTKTVSLKGTGDIEGSLTALNLREAVRI